MKHLLLAALLATAAPALAQTAPPVEQSVPNAHALDAKNGFRDYKLGTPITDYPNLKSKGKGSYTAPNESMKIGDYKIGNLTFNAYKGQLSSITFGVSGIKDTQGVMQILEAQYGSGENAGSQAQVWMGEKVTMFCQSGGSAAFPFFVVIISSNELNAQQKADDTQSAKKAAKDL